MYTFNIVATNIAISITHTIVLPKHFPRKIQSGHCSECALYIIIYNITIYNYYTRAASCLYKAMLDFLLMKAL